MAHRALCAAAIFFRAAIDIVRRGLDPRAPLLRDSFDSVTGQDRKTELSELRIRLEKANTFRNRVVHANWGTLKKNGDVRTKILTDSDDGGIGFENVKITSETLGQATEEIDKLINDIDVFFMDTQNAGR